MVATEVPGSPRAPVRADFDGSWAPGRRAYVVVIKDEQVALAVADSLRARLKAAGVSTPVVIPAERGARGVHQSAKNGGWAGATLIALDDAEFDGLAQPAFVAVRPESLGQTTGTYGHGVVLVPATTAGELVAVVVAQASVIQRTEPTERMVGHDRSMSPQRQPHRRRRNGSWTPVEVNSQTATALLDAVRSQRNTRRVGMVVLAGALGFGGWMLADTFHPEQASASQLSVHHERGQDSSYSVGSGRVFGFQESGSHDRRLARDIDRMTKQLGLPDLPQGDQSDRHAEKPKHSAKPKHHKSEHHGKKKREKHRDDDRNPPPRGDVRGADTGTDRPGVGDGWSGAAGARSEWNGSDGSTKPSPTDIPRFSDRAAGHILPQLTDDGRSADWRGNASGRDMRPGTQQKPPAGSTGSAAPTGFAGAQLDRSGVVQPSTTGNQVSTPTAMPPTAHQESRPASLPPLSANPVCDNGSPSAPGCSGDRWGGTTDPSFGVPNEQWNSAPFNPPNAPAPNAKPEPPSHDPSHPQAPFSQRLKEGIIDLGDAWIQGFKEGWDLGGMLKGPDEDYGKPPEDGKPPAGRAKSLVPPPLRAGLGLLFGQYRAYERTEKDTDRFTRPFDPNYSTYRNESKDRMWGQPYPGPTGQKPYHPPELYPAPTQEPYPSLNPEPPTPDLTPAPDTAKDPAPAVDSTPTPAPDAAPTPQYTPGLTDPLQNPATPLHPYLPPAATGTQPAPGGGAGGQPGGSSDIGDTPSPSPSQEGPGTTPAGPDAPSPATDPNSLL